MNSDAIREALQHAVPLNRHLGLEILEIGEATARVRLPDADELKNHIGSQHAAALFALGEAASGAAVVGAFAAHMSSLTALARGAQIRYRKIASGPIIGTGRVIRPVSDLLETVLRDGRTEFDVDVHLADESGAEVAEMFVTWHLRQSGRS